MRPVTPSEWREWTRHPVTEAQKQAIQERIEEVKNQIVASNDADYDRVLKGMIIAYQHVLGLEPGIDLATIEEAE